MKLRFDPAGVPADMREVLSALGEEYPIVIGAGAPGGGTLQVRLEPGAAPGEVEVTGGAASAVIRYDRPAQACRGIGALLAGLPEGREHTPFATAGIMLDGSRNAVMTVGHFQRWLRRLALFGYNMAMLYTEETYELPGEDYFGYLRGRYSAADRAAIDRYAARLGIEMIGCIQTLGHLEQMLKWSAYGPIKDTSSVLLVGDDRTYALIEKMIAAFAGAYRSRRIHIGMDETHDLGRGRFQDLFGYRRGYDLFNEHLQRVVAICERHGLRPMLWSDMFFRLGNKRQAYVDPDTRIPEDVKRNIPASAQLVYWDYYNKKDETYATMIRQHRELGFEPIMGSGVWTWSRLWYDRDITEATVRPCVAACRDAGVREIFFTLWGDDGGYCEFDSALAGLAWAADLLYGGEGAAARFGGACGADYEAVLAAAEINGPANPAALLWDDPLLRIAWRNEAIRDPEVWKKCDASYARVLRRLRPFRETAEPVDLAHACAIARFLRKKIALNALLDAAYPGRDAAGLAEARRQIKGLLRALERLHASFRRQWYRRNKPFGFETVQLRLGGMRQRYLELDARLAELEPGAAGGIPEFDERRPAAAVGTPGQWRYLAASGIV